MGTRRPPQRAQRRSSAAPTREPHSPTAAAASSKTVRSGKPQPRPPKFVRRSAAAAKPAKSGRAGRSTSRQAESGRGSKVAAKPSAVKRPGKSPSRFRRTSSSAVEEAKQTGAKKARNAHVLSLGFKRGPRLRVSAVALLGIIALVGAFIVPPVFNLLDQIGQARALHSKLEQAKAENVDLRRQVKRWSDPAFMASQARERLGYVKKGETQYVVMDPGKKYQQKAQIESHKGPKEPWFMIMSQTTKTAGKASKAKAGKQSSKGSPQEGATQVPKEKEEQGN
nr:hypothetical protein CYJ21_08735 [Actinomyces sp. UMB0138]